MERLLIYSNKLNREWHKNVSGTQFKYPELVFFIKTCKMTVWKVRFLFCCLNLHVFILKRHITALSNNQALEISAQCEVMDANC